MEQFICKENIPPYLENKFDSFEQPRKHVHFETPPRPMPLIDKTPILQENPLEIFGQNRQDSNKLDLSILDTEIQNASPMTFGFSELSKKSPLNKYTVQQTSPFSRLVSENDFPCTLSMNKTPAPNICFPNPKNVYEMSDEHISSMSKSKKQFNMNRKIDDQGFFTLPNTTSKFSMENNLQPRKEDVASQQKQSMSPLRLLEKPCAEKRKPQHKKINPHHCQKEIRRRIQTKSCHCDSNACDDQDYDESCNCENCNNNENYRKTCRRPNKCSGIVKRVDSEPTVSDLYNIIKIQNERLQNLQSRVDQLLNAKQIEDNKQQNPLNPHHMQCQTENNKTIPVDNEMHKISIGVMTSFEVVMTSKSVKESINNIQMNYVDECIQTSHVKNSEVITNRVFSEEKIENCQRAMRQMNFLDGIKPYNNNENNFDGDNDENRPIERLKPHREKKRRVKNDDFDIDCVETDSLMQKLQQTKSPPVSPQSTMNLNFQDYSDSEDECSRPGVGWTFYNNCMNHVNQILNSPPEVNDDKLTTKRKNKTKLNQLKRLGFGSNDNNTSKKYEENSINGARKVTFEAYDALHTTSSRERYTTETSVHMNNLAAKYLNNRVSDERLKNKATGIKRNMHNPNYTDGLRNEMSFSTHQYMQKHQLLSVPHDTEDYPKLLRKMNSTPQRYELPRYIKPTRILDITAIKQQPKLL